MLVFLCGFGLSKSYVDGKVARFDGCEADTWSPLWLTDFMEQLGYSQPANYSLYWLLPGQDLGSGLRIIDRDIDTMHMISVVPKFQYFKLFVDHKDMSFSNDVLIDDVLISGSPNLPPVLSPNSVKHKEPVGKGNPDSSSAPAMQQPNNYGHELRRSRRKLEVEEVAEDNEDSELDEDWADSENEVGADDDDLFEEWVDEKFEESKKKKSKWVDDSDYDTDADLEELEDSDIEAAVSGDEVEVVDKQGRKKKKKKVELRRWRPENMTKVEFKIGMVFLSVIELRGAIQEYIIQQRVGVHYKKNDLQRVRACCEPNCPWYLYASPCSRSKAWTVKKLAAATAQPKPIQIVLPDDDLEDEPQPPKKITVKRNSSAKKKVLPQMETSATASIVASAMNYDVTSSSVFQVLQEQAAATQQSQAAPPDHLPESQFIASCRDDLPPPRPPIKTLGLAKKRNVGKKKENKVPA